MNTPKISIITITYNSEKTLEETIQSVVTQDYDNLEYLIIDGGSKDHTLDIVNKYQNKISTVVSEPDKGISDAFNKGIKLATGEIIGIINSDDILLPNALNTLSDNYEESVDVYRGNTISWNDQTETKLRGMPSMEFSARGIRRRNVSHQSTFVTKRTYQQWGGYDVNLKFMMDADLLIRLYEAGTKWKYVNADLALSRSGGVTDKNSFWKKRKESYVIVKNNGGGSFFAFLHMLWFLVRQSIKSIAKLFGLDWVRKHIYSKSLIKNLGESTHVKDT